MLTVKDILKKAADGSDTNATSSSLIRPSKAGQPLAALVLENLVFSKLPQPEASVEPTIALTTAMSIATGFVFEAAALPWLKSRYPEYVVFEQPELKWKSFVGRADYILVSPDKTHVVVIDCKAFGVGSKREIVERKLTPGWGYPTQLAIYGMGASEVYPEADIELAWCCWCVPTRKIFMINQTPADTIKFANEAHERMLKYEQVLELVKKEKWQEAADVVAQAGFNEQLPAKGFYYNNVCASAPIHYSPYQGLFFPAELDDESDVGYAIEGKSFTSLLAKMLEDATKGTSTSSYDTYLQETYEFRLDNH